MLIKYLKLVTVLSPLFHLLLIRSTKRNWETVVVYGYTGTIKVFFMKNELLNELRRILGFFFLNASIS